MDDSDTSEIEFVCQVAKNPSFTSTTAKGKSSPVARSPGFSSFNRFPFPAATNFANTNMGRGRQRPRMRGGYSPQVGGHGGPMPSLLSLVLPEPDSRGIPRFPIDRPHGPFGEPFRGPVDTHPSFSSNWQIRPPLSPQRGDGMPFRHAERNFPDNVEWNHRGGPPSHCNSDFTRDVSPSREEFGNRNGRQRDRQTERSIAYARGRGGNFDLGYRNSSSIEFGDVPPFFDYGHRRERPADYVNGARALPFRNSLSNSRDPLPGGRALPAKKKKNKPNTSESYKGSRPQGKSGDQVSIEKVLKLIEVSVVCSTKETAIQSKTTNSSNAGPQAEKGAGSLGQSGAEPSNKVAGPPKTVPESQKQVPVQFEKDTQADTQRKKTNEQPQKNATFSFSGDDSYEDSQPDNKKQRTDSESKYCKICEVSYTESTQDHRESNEHKILKAFLNPVCADCKLTFDSTASYSMHCSLVHETSAPLTTNTDAPKRQDPEDQEIAIDELFFIDKVPSFDRSGKSGAVDSDSDSVCHMSSGEAEESSKVYSETEIRSSKQADGARNEDLEPPARDLPDFVVSACYCNLCCVFFHDDESVINRHCESRKHLENIS